MSRTLTGRLAAGATTVAAVAAVLTAAVPAQAADGPSLGTGYVGACNMLLDRTMVTVAMAHDAPQGNAGMFRAVAVSGCG
jgi:hypothetical protein